MSALVKTVAGGARNVNVGVAPSLTSPNPYLPLLYEHLEAEGIRGADAALQPWNLRPGHVSYEVLHLHWPEYILGRTGMDVYSRSRSVVGARALVSSLRRLRRAGIPTVWTVHNRRPHASNVPAVHRWLYRTLAREVDALVVHSAGAADLIRQDLHPRAPINVIAHGNYASSYGEAERGAARRDTNVSDHEVVLLSFGSIAPYKGVLELLEVFRNVAHEHWRLLIAGPPATPEIAEKVRQAARRDPRVHVDLRFIPDEEVARLFAASDAAIFNYRDMFSSGAVMLAHTQGVPTLVRRTGLSWELSRSSAVEEYEPNAASLEAAVGALVSGAPPAVRRSDAVATAAEHPWSASAAAHANLFRGLTGSR